MKPVNGLEKLGNMLKKYHLKNTKMRPILMTMTVTSLNKNQFRELFQSCNPVQYGSHLRNVTKKHLITFFMKMRQGLSNTFSKTLFIQLLEPPIKCITIVRQSQRWSHLYLKA